MKYLKWCIFSALTGIWMGIAVAASQAAPPTEKPAEPVQGREQAQETSIWSEILKDKQPLVDRSAVIPDWQARLELARLLSYQKKYEEALRHYERVLEDKPGLLAAKVEKALVFHYMGKSDEAVQTIDKLAVNQLDERSLKKMAEIYMAAGRYETAAGLYQTYLKAHPGDMTVRFQLARLLSWNRQYEKSLAQYETILRRHPDDIQVRRHYALVLIWAGRHAEAARHLEKTLPGD